MIAFLQNKLELLSVRGRQGKYLSRHAREVAFSGHSGKATKKELFCGFP